jgi:hypothetical protein
MADIVHGEKLKKVFRMLLKLGYKTCKRDMEMIANDLQYTQNPVIANLNQLVILGASQFNPKGGKWQKDMTLGYGQALLWMVTKDTAYRDVFFWTLDKAFDHPEEFKRMLKPYVKPPEEWIANQWLTSKEKSRQLKKEGKIPKNGMSLEETIFTPSIQDKRHKKLLSKKD